MADAMKWRDEIAQYASERRRPVLFVQGGIGIEFADGCDVCWMLPGEVTSTLPIATTESVNVSNLLPEFERVDQIRSRVLHVVRHHLAGTKISVDRRRNGSWGVMTESGMSTSIDVGTIVTAGAVAGSGVHELVTACFKNTMICHHPSPKRIDRYLSMEGAPADERPIPKESPTLGVDGIRGVLGMMGLCRALDSVTEEQTPEQLMRAATAKGRIGEALLRVAERLPNAKACCELTGGSLRIEFEDGEADYVIEPKSRDLARQIRKFGAQAVGDEIADEYIKLNSVRLAVLNAIRRAAANRGWSMERIGGLALLANVPPVWHLGETRREVTVQTGNELTQVLRTASAVEAIRQMLAPHPQFANECVSELAGNQGAIELAEKELSPDAPAQGPTLRELDAATIAAMDAFADRAILDYFQGDRTIWDYGRPEMFDPVSDTWATMADWVRLAERHLGGEWPHPNATLILLDAGDPRGVELARRYLRAASPHHEVCEAEIELAWRFRHEMPEIARNWFAAQPYDSVPYADKRARLGDPVALRYLMVDGFDVNDEKTWTDRVNPVIARMRPSPEVRQRIRHRLLKWARTTWKWSPPEGSELRTALWLGLPEVAEAMEGNPFILAGLLTGCRRNEMMDEPGILVGGDFLLVWSKLNPTSWMARLVASVREVDILAEAGRVSRESVARNPKCAGAMEQSLTIYRAWFDQLKVPIAIAWKRWQARASAKSDVRDGHRPQ